VLRRADELVSQGGEVIKQRAAVFKGNDTMVGMRLNNVHVARANHAALGSHLSFERAGKHERRLVMHIVLMDGPDGPLFKGEQDSHQSRGVAHHLSAYAAAQWGPLSFTSRNETLTHDAISSARGLAVTGVDCRNLEALRTSDSYTLQQLAQKTKQSFIFLFDVFHKPSSYRILVQTLTKPSKESCHANPPTLT
jgi:hypothetical protein